MAQLRGMGPRLNPADAHRSSRMPNEEKLVLLRIKNIGIASHKVFDFSFDEITVKKPERYRSLRLVAD
ncbi:hypothetical protein [Methylobacterium mesophilicum]|uniref:hypothetical protein n=1 Tax=Methylobacterium mesophilicum TaxID=39956 RepID=UPI001EE1E92F|nr:hypothetical protein [Methylobacterium mesophilicum]